MIRAVTAENQHLYGRQLDQMFRMRHTYYIEGHGWGGLTSQDGPETDEFDHVWRDNQGESGFSSRLSPRNHAGVVTP